MLPFVLVLVLRRFAGTRTPTRRWSFPAGVKYKYEYEYRFAEYEYEYDYGCDRLENRSRDRIFAWVSHGGLLGEISNLFEHGQVTG